MKYRNSTTLNLDSPMTFTKENMRDYLGFLTGDSNDLQTTLESLYRHTDTFAPEASREKIRAIADTINAAAQRLEELIAAENAEFIKMPEDKE